MAVVPDITCMQMLELRLKLVHDNYIPIYQQYLVRRLSRYKTAFGSHPLVKAMVFQDVQPNRQNYD